MKYLKFTVLFVLLICLLSFCCMKASSYYETVDEAISLYEEYIDYQNSVEGKVTTSDEEHNQNIKIALMQADAFGKVDLVKDAYDKLSDTEKDNLVNYIITEHDSKYNALVEWLQGTLVTYSDLDNAIKDGKSSSRSSNSANYSDSMQLSSGNYTVPDDIPAGTYDVVYVSGVVPSLDVENNGDNLHECFSEDNKTFSNLLLRDSAKIKIESGTIEFRAKK